MGGKKPFGSLIGYQTHVMALSQVTWTKTRGKMTNGAWTNWTAKETAETKVQCWIDDTAILLCNDSDMLEPSAIPAIRFVSVSRRSSQLINTYDLKSKVAFSF